MKEKGMWEAVLTFVGVIVGAGILGLPYVFSKVGVILGLILMFIFMLILGFSYIVIGEVCQRTRGKHQLVGLVEKYLGKKWKIVMAATMIVSLYGALVAYSLVAGNILDAFFGGGVLIYSILFVLILSIFLFFKFRTFAGLESAISLIKIIFCLVVGIYLLKDINVGNLLGFNVKEIVYPLGVIMFALCGVSVIPIMNFELIKKNEFKKAIWIGLLISVIIYAIFAVSFVGVMGSTTPEVATMGLQGGLFIIVNIFVLLALITAFLGLGLALKETYVFDFKMMGYKAWILLFVGTLVLVIFNPASFIKILGLTGALSAGLATILLYYAHSVARKKSDLEPSYKMNDYKLLKILFSILFLFVLILEIISLFVV